MLVRSAEGEMAVVIRLARQRCSCGARSGGLLCAGGGQWLACAPVAVS